MAIISGNFLGQVGQATPCLDRCNLSKDPKNGESLQSRLGWAIKMQDKGI